MKILVTIVLIVADFSLAHAQQYGWVRIAQIGNPNTNALRAVEFVDSLHGWVSGNALYRTTDGGTNWSAFGVPFVANAISMFDTTTGWAAGQQSQDGRIYKTTNGGVSWLSQFFRISNPYIGSATLSVRDNITSGYKFNSPDTGKVIQTTNGGTSWTERTIADSIERFGKVQFVDSLHGWIAATVRGQPGGVLRTTDGGISWSLHVVAVFSGISFIDTLRGWAITPGRSLFKTTNGGISWQFLGGVGTADEDLSAAAISFVDSSNGWIFGGIFYQGDLAAAIYRTTDGGLSWSRELAGGGSRGVTGMMLDRYHGWAVGSLGAVFAYRIISSVPERVDRVPKSFALKQNYPNPFNPNTTIEYEVISRSLVAIRVFDTQGKEVRTVVNSEHEPGAYRIRFDATGLATGVYYYTMKANAFTETKQMVLLK